MRGGAGRPPIPARQGEAANHLLLCKLTRRSQEPCRSVARAAEKEAESDILLEGLVLEPGVLKRPALGLLGDGWPASKGPGRNALLGPKKEMGQYFVVMEHPAGKR